jgi:putative Ca2+/H+ antiporter (TMEM165/GDT1 family)
MSGLQQHAEGEELLEAEEEMEQAEKDGRIKAKASVFIAFWEVVTLIFLAEWGDRSMLATIALAVHSDPLGVTVGATLGHAFATVIAVVAGSFASKYISERVVSLTGGVLFLLFAAETAFGLGVL